MEDILNKLKSKLKKLGNEMGLFLSSVFFLKNLGAMLGTILFLFLLTTWWLTCYTRHGESLQVNDFVGMDFDEANKIADEKDFKFSIVDSSYVEGKEPNSILDQSPKPLSRVKKGRTIYVSIAKFTPDKERLPTLKDKEYEYDRYARALDKLRLKPMEPEKIFDLRQEEGTILYLLIEGEKVTEEDLENGVEVDQGSEVGFMVTTKVSKVVSLPNLVCKQYDAAEFLISSSSLTIGQIFEDNVINKSTAFVWKQEPAYESGIVINKGEQINLYLTQDRPSGCVAEEF